jgi:hypothetical protein
MGGAGVLRLILGFVVIVGIAAFANGATRSGISGLFDAFSSPEPAVQFTAPAQPVITREDEATEVAQPAQDPRLDQDLPPSQSAQPAEDPQPEQDTQSEVASLDPELTDEDAAVLDALRAPVAEAPEPASAPTIDDARTAYAVSGIWTEAPEVPGPPAPVDLEDLYVTSIDPINPNFDAVALPMIDPRRQDQGYLAPASPAPAGTRFSLDERGLVVPTPDGSLNPDGIMIFAGPPAQRPPANLVKAEEPGEDLALRLRLSAFRPNPRPGDLIETAERANFSGLTRSELGAFRPRLRPESAQESARASASLVQLDGTNSRSLLEQPEGTSFDSATARAVVASLRPDARPKDFESTVAKALERASPPPATANTNATAAAAVAVAPRSVTPSIPSSASVTREATVKNAINLREVNLIGVYGKPSDRRALVRLGNGSYQKVQVGDRIDGGQVSSIGDSELRYQKSGRAIILKMPRG